MNEAPPVERTSDASRIETSVCVSPKGLDEHPSSACFDGVRRDPVDMQASKVFAKGIQYEMRGKILNFHSEICPPVRIKSLQRETKTFCNLKGVRFGRFTVVGLSRDVKARWVVRCACGTYEMRTAKAIKNELNTVDCCEKCRKPQVSRHMWERKNRNRQQPPSPNHSASEEGQ